MAGCREIEPEYTAAQREELARIGYLMAELTTLRDRGLLADESLAAVAAEKEASRSSIERQGRAVGLIKAARAATGSSPREALELADEARTLAPELPDAWPLAALLHRAAGDLDGAIAVCRQAIDGHGHESLRGRLAAFEKEWAERDDARAIATALGAARESLARGNAETALLECRAALARAPRNAEARELEIDSLSRLGRTDEALARAEALRPIAPIRAAELRRRIEASARVAGVGADKPVSTPEIAWVADEPPAARPPLATAHAPEPTRTGWSTIAAEFLLDHWQKLILSLAVLLIVVSSTVGAAIVLGDKLWRGEGKCLLATAYTLMFAGFGRGLAKWGAERAGRIMRLTTLIVLPLNFALVGELPMLGRSTALSIAVFAVDTAAMAALTLRICRSMGISGGLGTPLALIALGLIDAFISRAVEFPGGFAALVAASAIFAAGGAWLGARLARTVPAESDEADAPYFAFGLLTFAFLCVLVRIGGTILHLPPTLYALPAMLAVAGAIAVAEGLEGPLHAARPRELLKLAGFVLASLAFALGLARPPERLAIFSGSTLVTAVAGLGLFARALVRERRPAFLYATFAGAFLAYFGIRAFLGDLFVPVESRIGHVLGYGHRLPSPFRALIGLGLNVALAALAVLFQRRWNDRRLALHCRYIGLPVSLASCALSVFEPLAGVLTLGSYVALYGVGAWRFAWPGLVYLACAAFVGAALEASLVLGGLAAGGLTLAMAVVGLTLWASGRVLAGARDEYRGPVVRSTRMVAFAALVLTAFAAWPWDSPSWTTAASGWVLALLYLAIGFETPRPTLALAAGSSAAVSLLLTVRVGTAEAGTPIGLQWLASCAAGIGLVYASASARLRRIDGPRSEAYVDPLFLIALALAGLTAWLVGAHVFHKYLDLSASDLAATAVGLGLISAMLVVTTAWSWPSGRAAFAGLLAGSVAAVAGALAVAVGQGWPVTPIALALASAGLGLALVGLGEWAGRSPGRPSLYGRPAFALMLPAVALAWLMGGLAWQETRALTVVLTLTALSLAFASRRTPERPLPELALASGLAAWLCGLVRLAPDSPPTIGMFIGLYLVIVLAVADRCAAFRARRPAGEGPRTLWLGTAVPEFVAALMLVALGLGAVGLGTGDFRSVTAVLALGAVAFPWVARFRAQPGLAHVGLILAWLATLAATRWTLGAGPTEADLLARLALMTAVDGLALCGICIALARSSLAVPLHHMMILMAAAASGLALAAASPGIGSYARPVLALLLVAPVLLVEAMLVRSAWRVYAAIVVGIVASYLSLFELGRGRPPYVPALGVLASLLAMAAWGGERAVLRRLRVERRELFAGPLRHAAIALAFLALVPDFGAPGPLLLAGLPFLLLIASVPSSAWLYATLAAWAGAGSIAFVWTLGGEGRAGSAVAAAFGLWGLGLTLARSGPTICHRLSLPRLRLEFPPYHVSIALAITAAAIRIDSLFNLDASWSSGAWLPVTLAVLMLLMLRPYPTRGWVDGAVGLLCLALEMVAAPTMREPMGVLVLVLVLTLIWRAAESGAGLVEVPVGRRLGVGFTRFSTVFHQWALGLLAVATIGLAAVVVPAALSVAQGRPDLARPATEGAWWTGLVAILLFGANLDLAGRVRRGLLTVQATALPLVWWLGLPGSPLLNAARLPSDLALSLGTVALALATARLAWRRSSIGSARYAFLLVFVAIGLTGLRVGTALTATLFLGVVVLAAVTPMGVAVRTARVAAGLWMGAWLALALQAAAPWGWDSTTAVAAGQAIASVGLIALTGSRRIGRLGLTRAFEEAAVVASAVTAGVVGLGLLGGEGIGEIVALSYAAILIIVATVFSIAAARWDGWVPATAAQLAILGAYAAYRSGFAVPGAADSMVALILAGIDLGIAEVTGRLRRPSFAGPALAVGLILPMAAVGLALQHGWLGDEALFVLFAAGSFYAAVGGRLRRRRFAYPAGVLLNAALWVFWARAGWRLADDPQFFLVPVGMSTILFAEANRRALGGPNVDAIRGISLMLIYLSLAVPIWQAASLAAWAAILAASLLSIFAGIGLRSRSFLWLGLAGFLVDVLYQVGRIGTEHALAKWAIMLLVGIGLVFFVALNEKKRLVATLKDYLTQVRQWD